ncbi:MAG: DUF3450 domain-containing protein [Clostridia bacterium]|nr:DUF3450 domain-containing protein [Clostridia bacterium]
MKLLGSIRKRRVYTTIFVVIFSFALIHIVQAVTAVTPEPGTEGNPLVSQDYVDTKLAESDKKIAELTASQAALAASFEGLNAKNTTLTASNDDLAAKNKSLTDSVNTLTAKVEELNKQITDIKEHGIKFEIVSLKAGQQLIAGASAEIILRSGKATAIAGKTGGVSDLISGKDLKTGVTITPNHLLLIPADDGRGLKAVNQVWILIKGTYTIK